MRTEAATPDRENILVHRGTADRQNPWAPTVDRKPGRGFTHRGVAYWSDGKEARVFLNSCDRLYTIHAATGKPDTSFGQGGNVVQTEGHGRPVTHYEFDQTAAPVVFEDPVIVGSRGADGV